MSEYILAFIGVSFSVIVSGGLVTGAQMIEYLVRHPQLMVAYDAVFWSSFVGMFLLPYSLIRKAGEELPGPDRVALSVIAGTTIAMLVGLLAIKIKEVRLRRDIRTKLMAERMEAEAMPAHQAERLAEAIRRLLVAGAPPENPRKAPEEGPTS